MRTLATFLAVLAISPATADVFVTDIQTFLWQIGDEAGHARRVGRSGVTWDDIALAPDGTLYGIGNDNILFEIQKTTGLVRQIAQLEIDTPWPIFDGEGHGLAISADGIGYVAAREPFGTGGLYSVNLSTGVDRRVGSIGHVPRGDLVFDDGGRLLMSACHRVVGFDVFPECDNSPDDWVQINLQTGEGAEVGSMDWPGVTGLANVNGSILGITGNGELLNINSGTGVGTHIGTTVPRILATGATATGSISPPQVERLESRLGPLNADATHLAIVTHGWNGPLDLTPDWVDDFADAIRQRVSTNSTTWDVNAIDWSDLSGGSVDHVNSILNTGINIGRLEGGIIGPRGYQHVHVMASSAGAGLATALSNEIKRHSLDTTVHVTYLDPFTPHHPHAGWYGDGADWVENYFTVDATTGGPTEVELPSAHNVDLSEIAPLIVLPTAHIYPRQWYQKTFEAAVQDPNWAGYGWPLAKEAFVGPGEWMPSVEHPANVEVSDLPQRGDGASGPQWRVTERITETPALSSVLTSTTGDVEVTETTVELAANFGDPALGLLEVTFDQPWNFFSLGVEFTEHTGEAMLSVSLDDNQWTLDGRSAALGKQEYFFPLDRDATTSRQLSLRLDGFDNLFSSVLITDLVFGQMSVTPYVFGDFDGDQAFDVDDADRLVTAIAEEPTDLDFDVNLDGRLTGDDVSFWIQDLANSWIGDTNVDGEFNSNDLVQIFQTGKFEQDVAATWSEGDWTGDGRFSTDDLVAAFQDGGYEQGPRPMAFVPEPSSLALFCLALLLVTVRRFR